MGAHDWYTHGRVSRKADEEGVPDAGLVAQYVAALEAAMQDAPGTDDAGFPRVYADLANDDRVGQPEMIEIAYAFYRNYNLNRRSSRDRALESIWARYAKLLDFQRAAASIGSRSAD